MKINCIILAGGKGIRLGRDKVLETLGSKSLLEQVVSRVRPLCEEIIIVTSPERTVPQLTGQPRLRIVNDTYPGKGPLVGICTGLATSDSFYNLVVASDMPFLNEALLRYMVEISVDFDIVVPRLGKLVEPLHAVYARSCLQPIEKMIKHENLSVSDLFGRVSVRYVEAEEINRFDPEHISFFNINTKADLEKARQLARRQHGID